MSAEQFRGTYGMEQGCPDHSDDHMVECGACGNEFCLGCFPQARTCPNCTEEDTLDGNPIESDNPRESSGSTGGLGELHTVNDGIDNLLKEADQLGKKEDLDTSFDKEK